MKNLNETPLDVPVKKKKKKKMVLLVCLLHVAVEMKTKVKETG